MEPVRTCLGCRQRDDRSALLRVVARDGQVVADVAASMQGRGAWVHPTRDCIETAIRRRAFGRALRVTGDLDTSKVDPRSPETFRHPQVTADRTG
ncbi:MULTISPECIES: YlxR family protein [unclassified Cryobacterium]|uniref:YlxR family protein n=1 Tax=unclassified Cryobacterium TaxID=2649013 RepID=UPI001447E951|nr:MULTISPECIES: YlxR family protein [unclassified Cryobacterium]